MNCAIKILFLAILALFVAMDGTSHALPSGTQLTFEDTVTPSNPYRWTHTLHLDDFSPHLDPLDRIRATDASLDIRMDFRLGSYMLPYPFNITIGYINILADGDNYRLDSLDIWDLPNLTPNQTYTDYLWRITLGSNHAALNAISDKSFVVSLELGNNLGSIINVDSSKLSGNAIITPEPGSLLLLGTGLIGFSLYGRKRMKK